MKFLRALLDGNEREVARLRRTAAEINALEPQFEPLSDEALAGKTLEFRESLQPHVERLDEAKANLKAVRREGLDPAEEAAAVSAVKAAYDGLEAALNARFERAWLLPTAGRTTRAPVGT